jgi:ribonuclease P protein component
VSEAPVALVTLKKRAEFLRLRGGARCVMPAFVLETRPRGSDASAGSEPRFGFTVVKALGGAVVRNRIRRRLRAAVSHVASFKARQGHDYVLIARASALDRPFLDLKKDLERAFQRVHQPAERGRETRH